MKNKIKGTIQAVRAENFKIFHSKVFWVTCAAAIFMAAMAGFVMFILKNPDVSKSVGLVGQGGQIQGAADWTYYFSFLARMFSFGMFVITFSFVASWVFGREYSDRTIKDLLALPISRFSIVVAKFVAITIWCLILFAGGFAVAITLGHGLQLEGWSGSLFYHGLAVLVNSALLALLLTTVTAYLASYSKGYMVPLGFIALTMVLGNFISSLGYSLYFPWSIPLEYALDALAGGSLQTVSLIIVAVTGLLGFIATFVWWRYADQS